MGSHVVRDTDHSAIVASEQSAGGGRLSADFEHRQRQMNDLTVDET